MDGAGQGDAVAHRVGAVVLHRADMGGLDFRSTAPVDELQPGHGAALVIGGEHDAAEDAVAHGTRGQLDDAVALLLEDEGRLVFRQLMRRDLADARQEIVHLAEAGLHDAVEVGRRKRADR